MKHLEIIRALREDNDKLQKDIAEILKCSVKTYSTYEIGTRKLPVGKLIALANYYNLSDDYILGLTSKKERNI